LGSTYKDFRVSVQTEKQQSVQIASGKGAIATVSRDATEFGIQVLRDGGNAFDAAFAVGFALAVYHPQAGNIGGGGYILYKGCGDKDPHCINYREVAPSSVKKHDYLTPTGQVDPDFSAFGPKSVCVPGTVKAFFFLQKERGRLSARNILSRLAGRARDGARVSTYQVQCLNRLRDKLSFSPESKKIFCGRESFSPGDRLPNPNLAKTFETLSRNGEHAFYEGEIAECMERDLTRNGGCMTVSDLKNYSLKMVDPLRTEYRGRDIWTVPPEGGGAVLIEILNILNREEFFRIKPFDPAFYHAAAQAFKIASIDRYFYLGDVPLDENTTYNKLFTDKYAKHCFSLMDNEKDRTTDDLFSTLHPYAPGTIIPRNRGSGMETTHFSIIDSEGNAVSNSYTLNLRYGSKWSVANWGFLLNGSIDAFSFVPGEPNYFGVIGNEPNLLEPCKRPASSMAPVLVTKGTEVEAVMGTPGGPSIPSTLSMILLMTLSCGVQPRQAVEMGRLHHQAWPDVLYKEPSGLDADVVSSLTKRGYDIKDRAEPIGDVHGIWKYGDRCTAVSDFRREGYAMSVSH
jgi:gamma-glutamyltranspeptidase/glutathione hydrolase